MILLAPFPPDVRVEKEISSLVKFGFEVDLLHFEAKRSYKKVGLKLIGCKRPRTILRKISNEFHGYD